MSPALPRLRLGSAWACALAGAALFQLYGNATRGYIATSSLFRWWSFQWVNPASETEHGLIVLALSVWLLVRNLRREPARIPGGAEGVAAPAAALFGGLALHAVGFISQQTRISILGCLLFGWGVLALGGGRRWGRAAAFPIAFLVFAIPLDALDTVGFWLRMGVVEGGAGLAHRVGIGVVRNGTQLLAPDGRYDYDVAAACSGVRSLVALSALSLLVGYLRFRPAWLRMAFLALSLPLIFLANLLRILAIVIAAQAAGPGWASRVHAFMGFGVFAIVLGGVLGAAAWVERRRPDWAGMPHGSGRESRPGESGQIGETHPGDETDPRAVPAISSPMAGRGSGENSRVGVGRMGAGAVGAGVVAAAIGLAAFFSFRGHHPNPERAGVALAADGRNPVELPTFIGSEWIGQPAEVTAPEREILPPDTGFSRKLYVSVADPGRQVLLSIVLSGRDRTSIHRPELCLVGQGWTVEGGSVRRFRFPGSAESAAGPSPGSALGLGLAAAGLGSGSSGRAGGAPGRLAPVPRPIPLVLPDFPATVLRVRRDLATPGGRAAGPQLVAYWFVAGDGIEPTYAGRLWHDAWNRLVHGRADRWAYVIAQTTAVDGERAALARLQAILDGALPVFQPDLPAR